MKKYLLLALAALILAACGGGQKKEVVVRDVHIHGHLNKERTKKIFTVEDGTYTFSVSDGKLEVTLPFKTLREVSNYAMVKVDDAYVGIEDAEGMYIENKDGGIIVMKLENMADLNTLLQSKVGDITKLKFTYQLLGETNILDKIAGFNIRLDFD